MRVSLDWLREYVDIDVDVDTLVHDLTMLGLEIEAVERPGAEISNVVVGRILSIEPHPEADKIVVCKTDTGGPEPLTICCGARNMKPGDKVPTAVDGATLPGGFKIARRKMRGIESMGMMCSARELGLGEDQEGLLILAPELPVGADVKPLLGLDDTVLEIEVTPNRGDWASMIGVARELAARYGKPLRVPQPAPAEAGPAAATLSSVRIEAPDLCARYLGRVLTGLKVGPSPAWLARRVAAGGMRPINNVVDITNYVLLETGQPLHAFDLDKLAGNRIVVRRAGAGESIRTLDGQERPLRDDMLVIADAARAQCVAGIMGGADSEVGESTSRIFLESAWFQPASVRRTSRALGLASESSQRFQRGADPEMAAYASQRTAQLLAEVCGATVAPGAIDEHPAPQAERTVTLRFARTAALLGAEIDADEQTALLGAIGFEAAARTPESVTVRVPSWRPDVSMETDLIEEVARMHGFDRLPARLPRLPQNERSFAPGEDRIRRLRHFLVDLGLTELMHWTFTNPEDLAKARIDGGEAVALQNPLSERHSHLRVSLLPALLNCAAYNIRQSNRDIAVFEIGAVYRAAPGDALPTQHRRLGILLSGDAGRGHWAQPKRGYDFFDLKGLAEAVLEHLGLSGTISAGDNPSYQTLQTATLTINGAEIGCFGAVNHNVRSGLDLPHECFALELDLDALLGLEPAAPQFAPLPAYPPSLRDLAVVVDRAVPAGTLLDTARRAGGNLLRSATIFDVYAGKQLPAGKKSVAINLWFQSPERTLTENDTQKSLDKILRSLQAQHGAELR